MGLGLLLPTLGALGCGDAPAPPDRPVVVVTLFPLADLTARIAGDAATVQTLLPPRAAPSTWEATPGQLRSLDRARGLVSVGAGLDDWVEGIVPRNVELERLRVTDGMRLLEADHDHASKGREPGSHEDGAGAAEGGDPHVWLDPLLVRDDILPGIETLLIRLVPASRADIRARRRVLADSLTALDREIRDLLADTDGRRFIATHGAWSYFSEAYGLTSLGSLYERPGHQPSARGLADLIRRAGEARLSAVLAEPQLADGAARALAGELGLGVRVVDPLGGAGLAGRESYADMMRFNARAFRNALTLP